MDIDATDIIVNDRDPDFSLVGFNPEGAGPRRYLMLQRPDAYNEQDVARGMDRVSIERDKRYSAYSGIIRFELHRDRVLLSLDATTTRKLGEGAEFEVRFDLEDRRFEELRAGLAEVFKSFDGFADFATSLDSRALPPPTGQGSTRSSSAISLEKSGRFPGDGTRDI